MASTTSSRPFKVLSTLLIFLTTLSRFVTAATVLDSSKLPSCYSQCGPLTQANGACVPPAAPQTDQGTYQSCFCASTFLVQLYSTPTLSNCNACGTSDLTKIQSWYTNLCHGGVIVTPAAAAATATRTTTASTTTGTASSQTSGSSSRKSSQNNGGW